METFRAPPTDEPLPALCLECLHPKHVRACSECGRRCALVRAGRVTMTLAGFASFVGLLVLFFGMRRATGEHAPSLEMRLLVGVPLAIVVLTAIIVDVRRRTRDGATRERA
jgi:hypothetical protein